MRLLLANVFVPHLRVRPDIIAQQGNTLLRIEVDNAHTQRAQPVHSTLEVAAFTDYNPTKTKLPNQTAAIPAGRERRDHDLVAPGAVPSGFAERVGLAGPLFRVLPSDSPLAVAGGLRQPSVVLSTWLFDHLDPLELESVVVVLEVVVLAVAADAVAVDLPAYEAAAT